MIRDFAGSNPVSHPNLMSYRNKTVEERLAEGYFKLLDMSTYTQQLSAFGSYKGHPSHHEIAAYVAQLNIIKSRLIAAGYKNPTIATHQDGCGTFVMCDEDDDFYKNLQGRTRMFDVIDHTGMGGGSGNGFSVQLIGFNVFMDMGGPDETHGRRAWTNAPCMQCFPAEHAKRKAAGEIWNWPERSEDLTRRR